MVLGYHFVRTVVLNLSVLAAHMGCSVGLSLFWQHINIRIDN